MTLLRRAVGIAIAVPLLAIAGMILVAGAMVRVGEHIAGGRS